MFEIVRELQFDYAHRIKNHESKCKYLHGHRGTILVHAQADNLDNLGRVFDFSLIKLLLGQWINLYWDHQTILDETDTELIQSVKPYCRGGSPFLLPYQPTAEYMAHYLLEKVCPIEFAGQPIKITKIIFKETPNCSAIYTKD